jgi:hypothetical protein
MQAAQAATTYNEEAAQDAHGHSGAALLSGGKASHKWHYPIGPMLQEDFKSVNMS